MCGIVGLIGYPQSDKIESMTRMIRHRGPDDEKFYKDKFVHFGFRRLSIVDPTHGQQPFLNEDQSMVSICNGEIYNHEVLRNELESLGHKFYSDHSDSEVVIHAFEEWGQNCVNHMVGMFSFAVWNISNLTLYAARDRLGIKPFYYTFDKSGRFAFASEIKPLLLVNTPEVDFNTLNLVFRNSHNALGNRTCFRKIFRLLPGHQLSFRQGKLNIQSYWQIPLQKPKSFSEKHWVMRLRNTLRRSVERRMMSDVPIGAALSGGLDSSAIVALMSELSNTPIRTFTLGYSSDDPDIQHAKMVAEVFKCEHEEIFISPEDVAKVFPQLIWHMEEPMGSTGHIPLFLTFQKVSQRVKVLLVGEGADELFAGYKRYKVLSPWLLLPRRVKREVYEYIHWKHEPVSNIGKWIVKFKWNGGSHNIMACDGKLAFSDQIHHADKLNCSYDTLNKALHMDLQGQMVNWQLKAVDAISMAHSVEARVPFLDHELVELAMKIPGSLKCHGPWLSDKYILRRALISLIPDKINKREKFALQLSISRRFSDSIDFLADKLLAHSDVKSRGFFSPTKIDKLRKRNGNPYKRYQANVLWNILLIESWARTFLDRPIESVPLQNLV